MWARLALSSLSLPSVYARGKQPDLAMRADRFWYNIRIAIAYSYLPRSITVPAQLRRNDCKLQPAVP